jgi:hypothetical protein
MMHQQLPTNADSDVPPSIRGSTACPSPSAAVNLARALKIGPVETKRNNVKGDPQTKVVQESSNIKKTKGFNEAAPIKPSLPT